MVGAIHHVDIAQADVQALKTGMLTMPAHPDVEVGLPKLQDAGFRLVTLTNSPPNPVDKARLSTRASRISSSVSSAVTAFARTSRHHRPITSSPRNRRSQRRPAAWSLPTSGTRSGHRAPRR